LFILVCQLSSLIKIQHPTFTATAAYGSTPLAHSISRGVNKNTELIKGRDTRFLALFPFCVCTKLVYVVNVTVGLPLSAAKGKTQLQSRSRSREHPRLDISLNNFPRKARVKTQVRPPTFLSSTFRLFFFSWVIFYCLPQAFFSYLVILAYYLRSTAK
jgi:hypothetical protein